MNEMYNVAVIGVGMLGKRHLSSMLESELPMNVYCYDINQEALADFKWENKYKNKSMTMIPDINQMPKNIDFALLSMTSCKRREMFDELVKHANVKNIVFEKVLFQKLDDYTHVEKLLEQKQIHAWVNCARRQMDSYQNLKERLSEAECMEIHVSGGEWGMACNSIHFLDLIQLLTDSANMKLDQFDLLPTVVDSKRTGYKEVYGKIVGQCGKCYLFTISCLKNSTLPVRIDILTEKERFVIAENKQIMWHSTGNNSWDMEGSEFKISYQSQMTKDVVEDILLRGRTRLTDFTESARLHVKFIKPLIVFFEKQGFDKGICPIT